MVSREYRYPKNNQTLSMKVALITGITGQDGSYLAELLLEKGYEVHGIKRRSSSFNTDRIDHLYQDPHHPNQKLKLHYGDLSDPMNITKIIKECQPDEIYNLGAMSHVKVSFDTPELLTTVLASGLGTFIMLRLYIHFFKRKDTSINTPLKVNMNFIIGAVTALISLITAFKIFKDL